MTIATEAVEITTESKEDTVINCLAIFYEEGKGGKNFRKNNKFCCYSGPPGMCGFSIRKKIRCGLWFFGVFLCGFAVFGPPLCPPLLGWGNLEQDEQIKNNQIKVHQRN